MRRETERWVELGLAAVTGVAHGVFRHVVHWEFLFLIGAVVFWAAYAGVRAWVNPTLLGQWGLRARNVWPATAACAAAVVLGGGAMVLYDLHAGAAHFSLTIFQTFGLYIAWGYVQQFVLQAMVARHLRAWMPAWGVTVAVAVLFGLTHLPDYEVAGLAALAAAVWVPIYLTWRNLWPLGVCHAVLGTIALYVLIGYNPAISARLVVV